MLWSDTLFGKCWEGGLFALVRRRIIYTACRTLEWYWLQLVDIFLSVYQKIHVWVFCGKTWNGEHFYCSTAADVNFNAIRVGYSCLMCWRMAELHNVCIHCTGRIFFILVQLVPLSKCVKMNSKNCGGSAWYFVLASIISFAAKMDAALA